MTQPTLSTPRIRAAFAIACYLILVSIGSPARAQELWGLAGTFNNWNTADPQWTMTPSGEAPSAPLVLERNLKAGTYRFKFVRNGDWARGHLGAAATEGLLEEPGNDIPLTIRADAAYRFLLNPVARTWRIQVAQIPEPLIIAQVRGQPQVDRPFVVWTGDSLFDGPASGLQVSYRTIGQQTRRIPYGGGKFGIQITPYELGPLTVEITMRDGDRSAVHSIDLEVTKPSVVRWVTEDNVRNPGSLDLEAQWDGTRRNILRIARDAKFRTIDINPGGKGESINVPAMTVPAGTYAVQVRDERVVMHEDASLPPVFHPGSWRRFTYPPKASVDSVHLLGDFNGWELPGGPRAIELLSRADGTYSAIVDLPEGAHRYVYLINESDRVPDPANTREAIDPTGSPASLVLVGPTPSDFPEARPNEIELRAVRHYPESAQDFTPISRGLGLADVSISTLPDDVETVTMVMRIGEETKRVPMRRSLDIAGFDRFSARVMTGTADLSYSFTLVDGSASYTTPVFQAAIEPALETPDWAKGAVWYQLFPERFRNGNPKNDPSGPNVTLKRWTSDWYEIDPQEERAWRKRAGLAPNDPLPERQGGALFNMVYDRRYGGDLQGVVEKLDYLKDLGVTAIYLNPIFEAESLHKYDATDFRHIDDNLATPASEGRTPDEWEFIASETADPATWTWTAADRYFIDVFLPECRKRGLRVILDGVFNHTGRPFWAFRDIEERGIESSYKDWFFVKFDSDGKLESWESWFNTGSLPKFRQTSNGDLVPPVKQHIFNITRRWMDPNGDGDPSDGIDGWRLDVALDVGMPFWRDWRKLVKSINPDAIIIAEIWDNADPYLTGDAFETQMHYPFAIPVTEWLGVRPGMSEFDLRRALNAAFGNPPQVNLIHQNLFGSHDTDRYVSMLLNPGRQYDQGNRPQDHDFPYVDKRPPSEIYRRSLLGVAIQATYMGAPMVYYGDEVGMWGADDPTDRKPYPWPDTPHDRPDERADPELLAEYQRWFGLRSDQVLGPILRFGDLLHKDSGNPSVFVFERSLNGRRVIVVVNRQSDVFDASRFLPFGTADAKMPGETARYWLVD